MDIELPSKSDCPTEKLDLVSQYAVKIQQKREASCPSLLFMPIYLSCWSFLTNSEQHST